jgi:hypothetical protein
MSHLNYQGLLALGALFGALCTVVSILGEIKTKWFQIPPLKKAARICLAVVGSILLVVFLGVIIWDRASIKGYPLSTHNRDASEAPILPASPREESSNVGSTSLDGKVKDSRVARSNSGTKVNTRVGDAYNSAKPSEIPDQPVKSASETATTPPITTSNTQICPNGICANGPITGSPQVIIGKPIPLPRVIDPTKRELALADLRASSGSIFRLQIVGSSEEIRNFSNAIADLFFSAGWKIHPASSAAVRFAFIEPSYVYHGEGVACAGKSGSEAFESVKRALSDVGYPCRELAHGLGGDPMPDALIVIGTRIIPED